MILTSRYNFGFWLFVVFMTKCVHMVLAENIFLGKNNFTSFMKNKNLQFWLTNVFVYVSADGEVSVVEALLAELPSQFLAYMKNRNITPTTSTSSAC